MKTKLIDVSEQHSIDKVLYLYNMNFCDEVQWFNTSCSF